MLDRYCAVVRRSLLLVLASMSLVTLVACGTVRDRARDDLVEQLIDEGGLQRAVSECVVDKFFEVRTTQELKEFFAREGLTDAERAEFARLGVECAPPTT
ncbi:MAG: hypothetical protein KBF94_05885 [Ilumatobacteraceae bacterium]|nr:hypothetical protein [Ilumatobacteraceae bacterium]